MKFDTREHNDLLAEFYSTKPTIDFLTDAISITPFTLSTRFAVVPTLFDRWFYFDA